METYSDLHFVDLEKLEGIEYQAPSEEDMKASLPYWYHNIRKVKLGELEYRDLIRFLNMKSALKYVVSETILRLKAEPMAGSTMGGELLIKLAFNTTPEFWDEHQSYQPAMREVLSSITSIEVMADQYFLDEEEEGTFWRAIRILERYCS